MQRIVTGEYWAMWQLCFRNDLHYVFNRGSRTGSRKKPCLRKSGDEALSKAKTLLQWVATHWASRGRNKQQQLGQTRHDAAQKTISHRLRRVWGNAVSLQLTPGPATGHLATRQRRYLSLSYPSPFNQKETQTIRIRAISLYRSAHLAGKPSYSMYKGEICPP